MVRSGKRVPVDPTWIAFSERHPSNPFLALDPLYAVRDDVIQQIDHSVPGFFTKAQLSFERDLAKTTTQGFFLHRQIGGTSESRSPSHPRPQPFNPVSSRRGHSESYFAKLRQKPGMTLGEFLERLEVPPESAVEILERLAPALRSDWYGAPASSELMKKLQEFIAELEKAGVRSQQDREDAWRHKDTERRVMRRRQEAYAGWLVINPAFRSELQVLRSAWDRAIADRGGFPSRADLQKSSGESPSRRKSSRFEKVLSAFYQRWGLEQLLTWDLPLPLDPEVGPASNARMFRSAEEGITFFVPWYALRGGRYDLQDIAKRILSISAPKHLHDWLSINRALKNTDAGELTFQRMFWLYRCYFLVLQQRYHNACEGNVKRLDEAMAAIMGRESELIKKLRQRLARRLTIR